MSRTLSWWCFNPGLAMEEFIKLGVRSIVLTSGTLSPLDSFAQELNLHFPVRLENPHVISSSQVWVGVVPKGPSGYSFNSSYRNRDSLEYKQELGNAIVNFSRLVPDGLLVFFPSYYLLDQCIECWKNKGHASSTDLSTIWERICKYKRPVVEPKQSASFPHAIEDFEAKLRDNSTSGAVFFAVCRGKVSEGLDFADKAGRAVVITGLPFALKNDPKIRLKREYLDQQVVSRNQEIKLLTGEEWYVQQAARAVNQAVGRVIRHLHDYGAIIFCDERFAQQNRQCDMSFWLRPHIKCYSKFGDVVFTLTKFFREKGICPPRRQMAVVELSSEKVELRKESLFTRTLTLKDVDCSNKPVSSNIGDSVVNISDKLSSYLPANRSALSYKDNLSLNSKRAREGIYSSNGLRSQNGNKYHSNDDQCIVDLDSGTPPYEHLISDNSIAPCSSKKHKLFDAGSESNCTIGGTYPKDSVETTSEEEVAAAKVASEQQPIQKETIRKNTMPPAEKEARGSAFLMQVQEKLSFTEYKEFVELMKALKSKTMKLIPVLEAIAKLFSAPERGCLLRRFKDFVPTKYRPIYERHLKSHNTAGGSGS